jgi:hypothetical protein
MKREEWLYLMSTAVYSPLLYSMDCLYLPVIFVLGQNLLPERGQI